MYTPSRSCQVYARVMLTARAVVKLSAFTPCTGENLEEFLHDSQVSTGQIVDACLMLHMVVRLLKGLWPS